MTLRLQDEIITYWNLFEALDGNINNMSSYELYSIFGGYDRLNRLNIHFENILKDNTNQTPIGPDDSNINDIQLALISRNKSMIVIEALKRVKLYQFFMNSIIIGNDNCE